MCGSLGLVVMGDDICSRGCEFKSRRCIQDGINIFHIGLLENCIDVCLKRPKINEKEFGVGQFTKGIDTHKTALLLFQSDILYKRQATERSVPKLLFSFITFDPQSSR